MAVRGGHGTLADGPFLPLQSAGLEVDANETRLTGPIDVVAEADDAAVMIHQSLADKHLLDAVRSQLQHGRPAAAGPGGRMEHVAIVNDGGRRVGAADGLVEPPEEPPVRGRDADDPLAEELDVLL